MARKKRDSDEIEAVPAGVGDENSDVNTEGRHNRPHHSRPRGVMEKEKEVEELSASPSRVLRSFDRVRARKPGKEPTSARALEKYTQAQSTAPTIEKILDQSPAVDDARAYQKFADTLEKSKAQLRKRLGF